MKDNTGFTGFTMRSTMQDCAGLVFGALATASVVAGVAMGLVLLVA